MVFPLRIEKLVSILEDKKLDALIITSPPNIQYYLGVKTIADSTLVFYLDKRGEKILYTPILEYYRMRDSLKEIDVAAVSKSLELADGKQVKKSFDELIKDLGARHSRIGSDHKMSPIASKVIEALGNKLIDITRDIWNHRMIKDNNELEAIKKSIETTINGIKALISYIGDNVTDTELAGIFEHRVRRGGAEEQAFPPLILFKPENSYPHNLPVGRRISKRDLVLVDVGIKINGYCSDLTRTIPWGRISREERIVIEAINEAIENVLDKAQPGMKASEIDGIARDTLSKYGLSKYFIHGLGHGLGINVHEPPYITLGNNDVVKPGMVFTIEPGVYKPGKYGVRIEEDVLMTNKGLRVLSHRLSRIP
ncbi:MAG: aminopeptidase P family protein [Desulfurococcales archaeon]|nr:aminopeptidase P family protein [Desulfurococcales archaeon]